MITEIPSVIFFSVNVLLLPLPHDVAVIPPTDGRHWALRSELLPIEWLTGEYLTSSKCGTTQDTVDTALELVRILEE